MEDQGGKEAGYVVQLLWRVGWEREVGYVCGGFKNPRSITTYNDLIPFISISSVLREAAWTLIENKEVIALLSFPILLNTQMLHLLSFI